MRFSGPRRGGIFGRWALPLLLTAAALVLVVSSAGAQPPASRGRASAWTVSSSAMLELWSRGAAMVGAGGEGLLPLYSAEAREGKGAWRPLGAALAPLAARIARDSAFEVLHFAGIPLAAEDPAMALRGLLAPGGGSEAVSRTRAAMDLALPDGEQRATLAAFLRALDTGWRGGAADAWQLGTGARASRLAGLQTTWRLEFVPALAPYLASLGAQGGMILVQPALGDEGRILSTSGQAFVVAVRDGPGDGPLLAAVKELCFPLARRTLAPLHDPRATEVLHARAVVRCGEMLLARRLPTRVAAYDALFGAASGHALAERYPLPPSAERTLRAAVQRVAGAPVTNPRAPEASP